MTDLLIHQLDPELPLPRFAKPGDAGADLYARIDLTLAPGERALMPTGIAIALPPGFAAFIHPRSGLAIRDGLSMVNAPGTVDASYRGEIQVILVNMDRTNAISIKRGDRVAQIVIQRIENVNFVPVSQLPGTERGSGGFGSTGKK
ncbi:MAG: dUTP diphosphatase [Actinobacteria bacterium]|jgi:dUTP pyrophosphatase|uniref:dUTP diphosphatase n=1 Tax=freshwater metagenome TaxID=449393 RepID=A0A6J6CGD6_9ZZZZ|nr:dUTP diphosphatase [Actinomycetota bacterium]